MPTTTPITIVSVFDSPPLLADLLDEVLVVVGAGASLPREVSALTVVANQKLIIKARVWTVFDDRGMTKDERCSDMVALIDGCA